MVDAEAEMSEGYEEGGGGVEEGSAVEEAGDGEEAAAVEEEAGGVEDAGGGEEMGAEEAPVEETAEGEELPADGEEMAVEAAAQEEGSEGGGEEVTEEELEVAEGEERVEEEDAASEQEEEGAGQESAERGLESQEAEQSVDSHSQEEGDAESEGEACDDRWSRFDARCSLAATILANAEDRALGWVDQVAVAYSRAWNAHTNTLKEQDESNRVTREIIVGALTGFVAGAVGSVIDRVLEKSLERAIEHPPLWLLEGATDLGKHIVEKTGEEVGTKLNAPPLTAFPVEPFDWSHLLSSRVHKEFEILRSNLLDWQKRASSREGDFPTNWDPADAIEQVLIIGGQPISELGDVDIEAVALQLERCFWSGWLASFAYRAETFSTRAGLGHHVVSHLGGIIEERCQEIGIDAEQYAEVARRAAEEEVANARRR